MTNIDNKKNIINLKEKIQDFKMENITFSVSGRNIKQHYNVIDYLKIFYPYVNIENIKSIFGSSSISSPLYGGRRYDFDSSLNEQHYINMQENNIGISLTLTNHNSSKEFYQQTIPLLEKFHNEKNSVICVNDELAQQIKVDFPQYKLRASIIKNITSIKKLEKAFKIYDEAVIPMDKNDDDNFLLSLPEKNRIMLFGNANCAYTCPARTCYKGFSEINNGNVSAESYCSKKSIDRLNKGLVFFDVKKFNEMGFSNFKLIPLVNYNADMVIKYYSEQKIITSYQSDSKNAVFVCSYPKSGRTWLRFILANYFNMYFNINETIDLKNMFEFMPNNDASGLKGYSGFRFKGQNETPLVLFSHDKYNEFQYKDKKIIYLERNPYDTLVSYYFHIKTKPGYNGTISEFIRDKRYGATKLNKYQKSWEKNLNEKHLKISYEEMHENIYEKIKQVISYIGLDLIDEYLKISIQLSKFNNMKNIEAKTPIPGFENTKDQNQKRIREGLINNYKNHLSENDILYIKNKCFYEIV
jgi:hypothetical protein